MLARRNRVTAAGLGHRIYKFQVPKNILLTINKVFSLHVSLNAHGLLGQEEFYVTSF